MKSNLPSITGMQYVRPNPSRDLSRILNHGWCRVLLTLVMLTGTAQAQAEWSQRGDLSFQTQFFTTSSQHSATQSSNVSLSGNAEFNRPFGENGNLTISPFFRVDQHDAERTHVDLREFLYRYSADNWEANVGLGKIFWGVAESSNIVDIINQRDAVEGLDPENKLGQPMINLLLLKDWGEISLFVLPGFRERTFAGKDGRPRGLFVIDTDNAQYESSNEERHVDVAARVSGAVNEWDLGLHVFHGTAREPLLTFPDFAPLYYQITQVGADVQATLESWLLKTELVYRSGDVIKDHAQLVTGLEYSFYSVAETNLDIGVVAEYLYDDRADQADTVFQNDLLIGLRFALNDEQSTEALVGVITDLDGGANVFTAEASRRIGDRFKLTAEAVVWANTKDDLLLSQFANEDYIQLELGYFF